MPSVAIIGAGELGSSLARQLAAADVVSTVVLIDEAGKIAEGKALDIRQASPVDRYTTIVTGTTDVDAAIGASFVVIADRADAATGEWQDDPGVALLQRIARLNQSATILCAGARQISMIERGVRELGLPRSRVFGSAPEALRAAVISMTALEAGCVPREVSLTVVGRPPQQIIVPWDDAAIGGRRATAVLSPPAITRMDGRLHRLWPPGPMTLAGAATRLIRAALARSPQLISTFVVSTRDEGTAGRAAMLPATVTPAGLGDIVAPTLTTRDRVRLETVMQG